MRDSITQFDIKSLQLPQLLFAMILRNKSLWWVIIGLVISFLEVNAQASFPANGAPDIRKGRFLFVNAHIVARYDLQPTKGYLLIENGKVISSGSGEKSDANAVTIDLAGAYVYPGFIDLYSTYGIEQTQAKKDKHGPQLLSSRPGAYAWNEALNSDYRSHEKFSPDAKAAEEYLSQGFTTVLTRNADGYSRGTGALVSLANKSAHEVILQKMATHEMSFSKGSSSQDYPTSLMGAIALLRQTWFDAQWYASGKSPEINISLEKWNEMSKLPVFFETSKWQNLLRAHALAKEFNTKIILKGSGDEYKRADAIKNCGAPIVLPLHFPEAFDINDAITAEMLALSDLKHWELAPANPAIMEENGVQFSLTMNGLKDKSSFLNRTRKAIQYGLSEKEALKALTFTPALLLGEEKTLGHLQAGAIANFVVVDKPIFSAEAKIHQTWALGQKVFHVPFEQKLENGTYSLSLSGEKRTLKLKEEDNRQTAFIKVSDTTEVKCVLALNDHFIQIEWPENKQYFRLSGWKTGDNTFKGRGRDTSANWLEWMLQLDSVEVKTVKATLSDSLKIQRGKIIYPFTAYGRTEIPKQETVLFKNATVWTNEAEGILEGTDVFIQNGKIQKIGKNLSAPLNTMIVDATGKHLTSGIIDEHSHISISGGVNEAARSSSSEVRIGDVVRDDDVNMYRQLAGGVTTAQLLHGSANAIGGQSSLIKYRWGLLPEQLKFENADGFIKFALGENVKQSNWGDHQTIRFPQSRMGVEQVYVDFFSRAQAYAKDPNAKKDLQLDALVEILNKKRFITCHSYVQSEINMLIKVAESFNFKVNTFTHILEGYKVADIMKAHGCGASTFSDWWAYKYEVAEAIPYNAALMHEVGVLTAINSDDAEMARRLNQEAAKAVKYGGVSEEDAWKMITINPAKLLHIDNRTGSIKVGKDADIVLWSANPLSIYAKPLQTYVDGVKYFDIQTDALLRKQIAVEKSRLINLMLLEKSNGMPTQPMVIKVEHEYHCEDIDHYHGE